MARKKKPVDEGGGANWMDTYGDLVTLLLCFFVLLYSFSNTDEAAFQGIASSLQKAFSSNSGATPIVIPGINMADVVDNPVKIVGMPDQEDDSTQSGIEEGVNDLEQLNKLAEQIQLFLDQAGLGGEVEADVANFVLVIRFKDSIFFDSGKADLKPEAYDALNTITDMLVKYENLIKKIRVEGHTDNVRLVSSKYEDNWVLSGIRAANATRYIIQTGRVEPDGIYYAGYGQEKPVVDNSTPEGRQANRRVEFVIESFNIDALRALAEP